MDSNIISTYRPYPNDAKGSLRSAIKEGLEDFEFWYWEMIRTNSGRSVVIGGEINLRSDKTDKNLEGTVIKRAGYEEGQYTFKQDIGTEHTGRCIDHIMYKGTFAGPGFH